MGGEGGAGITAFVRARQSLLLPSDGPSVFWYFFDLPPAQVTLMFNGNTSLLFKDVFKDQVQMQSNFIYFSNLQFGLRREKLIRIKLT